MCGLSFYYSKTSRFGSELASSLELTKHRGPDSSGNYEVELQDAFIGLGHNRLSILDLSKAGNQPMHDKRGVSLIFNGEIYNHNELRLKLRDKGYRFQGNSDSEVILKLYIDQGLEAFYLLSGMYTVVILDKQEGKLHIARDSVGIKPIYITQNEHGIFGCSEIRGLKPFIGTPLEIDKNDLYEFFNTGFLYEPATGFKDIKKLLPGHIISIDISTSRQTTSRFKAALDVGNTGSFGEMVENAVSRQLIADVPVGVFFSGGADSSIIASMSGSSDLMFAEFSSDPSSDIDKKYSKAIASHLSKNMCCVRLLDDSSSIDDVIARVRFVAENTEELISDYTFWPTYQLSKAAYQTGYKVMLSGMGGDEAFAGYPRYHVVANHKIFRLLSPLLRLLLGLGFFPKSLNKKFSRLVSYSTEENWPLAYSRLLGYFNRKELKKLFGKKENLYFESYKARLTNLIDGFNGHTKDKVKMAQYLDRHGFLMHNLMVADKASMLASIELRVPLLSEEIVHYGMAEKSKHLIDNRHTKKPLRNLLAECLPQHLVERPKTGFNPPIDTLIKKIGRERLKLEIKDLEPFLVSDLGLSLIDKHFSN